MPTQPTGKPLWLFLSRTPDGFSVVLATLDPHWGDDGLSVGSVHVRADIPSTTPHQRYHAAQAALPHQAGIVIDQIPSTLIYAPEALRFFALLSWQPGFVETTGNIPSATNGNKIMQVRGTQRFTYVRPDTDHTASNALQRCTTHVTAGYDPFVSVLSYRTKDRDTHKAQPGRVIFVDDWQPAPGQLTPNFALETSPDNFHAFFVIDLPSGQRLTQHEYLELATRAAAAVGGDPSGIDLTQLTRVPGTINGKAKHDGWVVRLHEWRTEPYPLATLRHSWPTITRSAAHSIPAATDTSPASWSHLGDIDGATLLQSPRWQGLLRVRPQLSQLVLQRERVVLTRSTSVIDDSDSAQVACFVFNTVTARSRTGEHVPLNEIRSVARALQPALWPAYGDANAFAARIDREIIRYMPKGERNPVATKSIASQATTTLSTSTPLSAPTTAARRSGRPRGSAGTTNQAVLRALTQIVPDAFGRRCYYVDDLAARVGKAPRTIQRALHQLETEDRTLTRGQEPGRGGRAYAVLSVDLGVPKIPAHATEDTPYTGHSRGAIPCDTSGSTTQQTSENILLWNKEEGEHSPYGVPSPDHAAAGLPQGGSVPPVLVPASISVPNVAYVSDGQGYSVGEVEYVDGSTGWAVWDDATDVIIARFSSEAAALVYVERLLMVPLVCVLELVLVEQDHDLALCASYDPARSLVPALALYAAPTEPVAKQRTFDGDLVSVQSDAIVPELPVWAADYRRLINRAVRARSQKQRALWLRQAAALSHEDFYVLAAVYPWRGAVARHEKQQRLQFSAAC